MGRPRKQEVVERPESLNRSERPVRTPIHGLRDKLSVNGKEPGYHYIWVNDFLVDQFLEAAYEFVTHEVTVGHKKLQASQIGAKVSIAAGNGVTAYLMRCLDEDYLEELEIVNRETDEKEEGMFSRLRSKEDGQYGKVEVEMSKPLAKKLPFDYRAHK